MVAFSHSDWQKFNRIKMYRHTETHTYLHIEITAFNTNHEHITHSDSWIDNGIEPTKKTQKLYANMFRLVFDWLLCVWTSALGECMTLNDGKWMCTSNVNRRDGVIERWECLYACSPKPFVTSSRSSRVHCVLRTHSTCHIHHTARAHTPPPQCSSNLNLWVTLVDSIRTNSHCWRLHSSH